MAPPVFLAPPWMVESGELREVLLAMERSGTEVLIHSRLGEKPVPLMLWLRREKR